MRVFMATVFVFSVLPRLHVGITNQQKANLSPDSMPFYICSFQAINANYVCKYAKANMLFHTLCARICVKNNK